ncbi:MAG TPA: hypothetical protein VFJ52_13335 [Terriglobia bacterium]|nr:hypothetical protein [Terriglobia bacterium]
MAIGHWYYNHRPAHADGVGGGRKRRQRQAVEAMGRMSNTVLAFVLSPEFGHAWYAGI